MPKFQTIILMGIILLFFIIHGCAGGHYGGKGVDGGPCFHPDTKVLMADNSLKAIIDIKIGDKVKAYDIKNERVVNRSVVDIYNGSTDEYYILNGTIKVAPPHPFYTDQNIWVSLEELKKGQQIKSITGFTTIHSITIQKKEQKIYNIFVDELHNFFVLDRENKFLLVHEGNK